MVDRLSTNNYKMKTINKCNLLITLAYLWCGYNINIHYLYKKIIFQIIPILCIWNVLLSWRASSLWNDISAIFIVLHFYYYNYLKIHFWDLSTSVHIGLHKWFSAGKFSPPCDFGNVWNSCTTMTTV